MEKTGAGNELVELLVPSAMAAFHLLSAGMKWFDPRVDELLRQDGDRNLDGLVVRTASKRHVA